MNKSQIFKLGLLILMLISSVCTQAQQVSVSDKKCVPPFYLSDIYDSMSNWWDIPYYYVNTPDYATIEKIDVTDATGELVGIGTPGYYPEIVSVYKPDVKKLPLYFYSICAGKRSSPTIYFPADPSHPPIRSVE